MNEPNIRDLSIVQDQRGFWAHDQGNGYTIAEYNGEPTLVTTGLRAATSEPEWELLDNDETEQDLWGEPAWGQIDDEEYLREVERVLIAFWESVGKPEGAGVHNTRCMHCGQLATMRTTRIDAKGDHVHIECAEPRMWYVSWNLHGHTMVYAHTAQEAREKFDLRKELRPTDVAMSRTAVTEVRLA